MERMILTRLQWYLEHNNIYPEVMAGFRRGRSSIDCVVDLVTFAQQEKSRKRISAALFLDVKGAYDNVVHEAILDALEHFGLGGRVYRWIESFLSGRSFYVMTEDGPTSQHFVQRGVPQGAVLSPTLFNLAIVRLVHALPKNVCVSIYADDICLWASGVNRPQLRARLQKAANVTRSYLRQQGLSISGDKCALVAFTRKPMFRYSIKINGRLVPYSRHHKFLGVIIDRDISWSARFFP